MGGIDQSIGPGLGGFLAFFLLAMALWLLMRNMGKHLRNVSYMQEREEQHAAATRSRTGAQQNDPQAADEAGDVQTRPRSLAAGYPGDDQPKPRDDKRH